MKKIIIQPIGIIYSPHIEEEKTPIQPIYAKGIRGRIEIFEEYEEGLKDLDGFSHINLFTFLHKKQETKLIVVPFLDTKKRGVFSTCAPSRPNHIGFSTVKLLNIKKNILEIEDIDMLNETPLIDIKPFVKRFNLMTEEIKSGWQDEIRSLNEKDVQKIGKRETI